MNTLDRRMPNARKHWVSFCSVLLVVLGLLLPFQPDQKAEAADLSQFQAGYIISDSQFFDGAAMNSDQIQSFLNSKVPTCTINNGQPSRAAGAAYGSTTIADTCLKDYRQATPNMAAQPGLCTAYSGSWSETAAQIISKISLACNISPKVLLVLLEKEQSLITDTWPTVRQINQATGFACYDNGQPCVTDYAGFFYQVWSAARQLQRYGTAPFTWYPVGQTVNILYQANMPQCGSKAVFIQNRATAALYYYTPYTPNDAALAAGYGRGDACSAYGNRNFYQLYVDWFGNATGFNVPGEIGLALIALGGESGKSGPATANQVCGIKNSGCYQLFRNGVFLWSPQTGAYFVNFQTREAWARAGFENGWLGYPVSEQSCGLLLDGCYQSFQGGFVISVPGKSFAISNEIRQGWGSANFENGWLGYPSSDTRCGLRQSGCFQAFQNGSFVVYSPATGAHPIKAEVRTLWSQYGFENGFLGYPTGDPSNSSNTYTQTFEGGTISVTNGNAQVTSSNDPWFSAAATTPWLGSATTTKTCGLKNSGCFQGFQNGAFVVFSPATGAHPIKAEVRALWGQNGFENGFLGYPTSDPSNSSNTYTQTFEGGTVLVNNSVASLQVSSQSQVNSSPSPSLPSWETAISNNIWLGNPTTSKFCILIFRGCYQGFANGNFIVYSPSTGAHPVRAEARSLWAQNGFENGFLGYPTSDPSNTTNTYSQSFQGGLVTVTNGVPSVLSATSAWSQAIQGNIWLGSPTTPKYCTLVFSGCYQGFPNGTFMIYSPATGAHPVRADARTIWAQNGFENGFLGYPTSDPSNTTNTYTQSFQGGTVTVTNGVARIQ